MMKPIPAMYRPSSGIASRRHPSRQRIDEGTQTIYGVGLLIVLLDIVAAAVLTIRGPA